MMKGNRTIVVAALVVGCAVIAPTVSAQQAPPGACSALSNLRNDYKNLHTQMASTRVQETINNKKEFDAEEAGCISDYGVDLGIGITGLTSSFLDSLKDKACSAMDDYIASNLDALGSSIAAPLDLVGLDAGLSKRANCSASDSAEECAAKKNPFNVSTTRTDLGLDTDGILDDIRSEAPEIDNGRYDYDRSGNIDAGDYYGTRSGSRDVPSPNWNPQAGGRTQ